MGACCRTPKRVSRMSTEDELLELGLNDTPREHVEQKHKQEDRKLEEDHNPDLLRLLAEQSKVKNQRKKEDKESIKRKKRRAIIKDKLKNKESLERERLNKEKQNQQEHKFTFIEKGAENEENQLPVSISQKKHVPASNDSEKDNLPRDKPVLSGDGGSSYRM